MAKRIPEHAKQLAVDLADIVLALMVTGLVIYLIAVFVSYLTDAKWLYEFHSAIVKSEAMSVGIPCAAVGAFGVVALLLHVFPPEQQEGAIKIKFFGAEFTGPAGPITLWLLCFLAFIAAVKVLRAPGI